MFEYMTATAAVSLTAVLATLSRAEASPRSDRVSSGRQTLEVGEAHSYAVTVGRDGEAVVQARSDGWIGLFVYDGMGHLVDWEVEDDSDLECELRPLPGDACTICVVNLDGREVDFVLATTGEELERQAETVHDPEALLACLR